MMDPVQKLAKLVDKLPVKDRDFARSLTEQARRRPLSEKQMFWVSKLCEMVEGGPHLKPREAEAIYGFLDAAKPHLKASPRLLFRAAGVDLRLSFNRSDIIQLTLGGKAPPRFGFGIGLARPYFGKLYDDGRLDFTATVRGHEDEIIAALRELARDPAGVASRYGKMTGSCCMCGLPLTTAASTSVGYGEICASNWGLPYPKLRRT